MAHLNLLPNRHQALRQMIIILPHQSICYHYVVDITQYERVLGSVDMFGFEECSGVVAPVTEWV
jgi:hypothetical protein